MWRFIHLTDPHLASERDGVWNNQFLCTMMPEVMACVARDIAPLEPDFILATGDIVSTQTREAMFEARDLMESLGVPYYPMGGNHDFVLPESRAWFLEAFAARLPQPHTYYSFTHKNLHVVVLDAYWVWRDETLHEVPEPEVGERLDTGLAGARWAIPPEQLAWLEEDLRLHSNLSALVAIHYPAIPIPDRLRRPGLNDGGALVNGRELLHLLESFPQVSALFSGHVHLNFVARYNGLTQVVTSALPEFPVELRDVRVYRDRIEVETLPLSDPSFAERSLIAGKEWLAGTAEDRRATIPLR